VTLGPVELERLLAVASRRDRLIIDLLLDTALRLSELAGLRIGDLLPDGYLRVRGKGGKERLVPLGTVTEARLPDYLAHSRPRPIGRDVDHVFLARDGRPLTSAAIQHTLRRLGGRAGLDGVRTNPHTFRHTFAKLYLLNGGGSRPILLGTASETGLVEALDVAARLGMVRRRVLGHDAQALELRLEQHLAPAWPPCEDRAVVSEQAGRQAMTGGGRPERAHDIGGLDRPEGVGGEEQARVVVDDIEDLDVGPVGQAPVGRVGLSQLVGQRGLEPDERRARPRVGLGRDRVMAPEAARRGVRKGVYATGLLGRCLSDTHPSERLTVLESGVSRFLLVRT